MINRRQFLPTALFTTCATQSFLSHAQSYDLIIRGGRLIDPSMHLDTHADIAISGNRIAVIAADISVSAAEEIDATGKLVIPGLLDIHGHYAQFDGRTNFGEYFGEISTDALFKQPELAATLRRIAENGHDEFYQGKTAELIVEQMAQSDGLITLEDLTTYQAIWREPLRSRMRCAERSGRRRTACSSRRSGGARWSATTV